ncbi:hypothetical protein TIFTF001_037591 [Ficus carica]|uniref:Uncharacterized protein n=1 Tax=Ficus carica TaxID=3494 RepID=A0AA88E6C0_FICCA|nr:hypothetical protein TIFTF001_037591 [Ficus carica]
MSGCGLSVVTGRRRQLCAWHHVQGVDCPGEQHRPRILPDPGIQRAQKDTISLPSRGRLAPGNRILWSKQITPSTVIAGKIGWLVLII